MTATGSHFDFDSLRGAPLARNDIVLFGHFAILRQLLRKWYYSELPLESHGPMWASAPTKDAKIRKITQKRD